MNNKNVPSNDIKNFYIPINIKNYQIEKELFLTSNGLICSATNINIKEKVLIKIINKETFQHNCDEISLVNNEIYIMKIINHKHCIKLYEIIESPSYIYLIFEYSFCFKLSEYMIKKKKLTEDESLNLFKQLISVLIYLHDMKIGHLNIVPENILIDKNNNIKIFDFRYSTFYNDNEKIKLTQLGDENYLCPEIWSDKSCYPEYADVWSSGVLLYFLLVGQLPFKGINNYDLQKKIMEAEFPLPSNISKNFQELFKNIFESKIEERYNLSKILNCALFKEKNINKNNLPKGFNIFKNKYPIDDRVMDICKTYYEIDTQNLKQKLIKNIFDPQTSLYKQIISVFIHKKISSEIDLVSKKFNSYISNNNNLLDENSRTSNYKEYINKFEEIKKSYPEQKSNIIKAQEIALNKLNELLKNNAHEKTKKEIEKEKSEKKEEKLEDKKENKQVNKDNISKNKNNINKNKENFNKKNRFRNLGKNKRISMVNMSLSSKLKKTNVFENKLNLKEDNETKRRKSSAINTNFKVNYNFEKNISTDAKRRDARKKVTQKYAYNQNDIIKELNEEDKRQSNESSSINSTLSKLTKENKGNKKDIISSKDNQKKDLKLNSSTNKFERKQKEKKKTISSKKPPIKKEDFFNQIKGEKIKNNNNKTFESPDEIKKKTKEESKNESPIELRNSSSKKDVHYADIEIRRNSIKNLNILFHLSDKNANNKKSTDSLSKISSSKESTKDIAKETSLLNKKYKSSKKVELPNQRKRMSYSEMFLLKTKGLGTHNNDSNKFSSKDDLNEIKHNFEKLDKILDNQLKQIYSRKSIKSNINEKEVNDEDTNKEEKDEETNSEKELNTNRTEEEERLKKEEELRLKQEEEEKRRKELEEQEKRRKEKEEEEKRKEEERIIKEKERLEEEKRKQKQKEEEERIIKLEEEKRKQKEEEERIKKLKEEQRKQKEEEERIKKLKEEKRKQKEEEERIKKLKEEKRRQKEEEERINKLKEEKRKQKEEEERIKKLKEEKRRQKEEERKIKLREEKKKQEEEEEKRMIKLREEKRKQIEEEEKRIIKFKEEKRKQKEEEERLIILKEEKEKKEEEERIKLRKEENERKRRESQIENKKLLEEYERKQKEREEKNLLKESMRMKKEEELKKKRQLELNAIRDKNNKNNKKNKIVESDSLSKSSSDTIIVKVNKNTKDKLNGQQKLRSNSKLYEIFKFQSHEIDSDSSEDKEKIKMNKKNKNKLNRSSIELRKKPINNKIVNEDVKFKENNNNQEKPRILYHYQESQDINNPKSSNKSSQTLTNNLKEKIIYQPIQSNYNFININIINDNYLNDNKYNHKSFKKLKIKTNNKNNNKNKRNNSNHSIQIKDKISKNNEASYKNESKTEKNSIGKTKENYSFKNKYSSQISLKSNKNDYKKNISQDLLSDYEEEMLLYATIFDNNFSPISKQSLNKINHKENQKINNYYNNKTVNLNTDLVTSHSSIYSIRNNPNNNKTYQTNTKISKKINNKSCNIPKIKLNKSNKVLIKIRNNSSKKRKDIKDKDLPIYKGEIDYNEVSVKDFKETVNNLIKKYKKEGFKCSKKGFGKFKFYKKNVIHLVEIMRLGNGLLYNNITKS